MKHIAAYLLSILVCMFFFAGTAKANEVVTLQQMVKELSARVDSLEGKLKVAEAKNEAVESLSAPITMKDSMNGGDLSGPDDYTLPYNPMKNVKSDDENVRLSISGLVNRSALYADNGFQRRILHTDNDNLSSRFQLQGESILNEYISGGSRIEIATSANNSSNVDISNSNDADVFNVRRAEVWFVTPVGTLTLGQGDTASNFTLENDVSGTQAVGYGVAVSFKAGGLTFRNVADGSLGPSINTVFGDLDGLDRGNRIRYDTPSLYGFTLATSHVSGDSGDVALIYSGEFDNGTRIDGSMAAAKSVGRFDQYDGSISILFPIGISLTGGHGWQKIKAKYNEDVHRRSPHISGGKIGYLFEVFELGQTAVSWDYTSARHIAVADDHATSHGFGLVQQVDRLATELYANFQWWDLTRPGADFKKIKTALIGASVRL
jgi:hypothetical protein